MVWRRKKQKMMANKAENHLTTVVCCEPWRERCSNLSEQERISLFGTVEVAPIIWVCGGIYMFFQEWSKASNALENIWIFNASYRHLIAYSKLQFIQPSCLLCKLARIYLFSVQLSSLFLQSLHWYHCTLFCLIIYIYIYTHINLSFGLKTEKKNHLWDCALQYGLDIKEVRQPSGV